MIELITPTELAGIETVAAKHGLRLTPPGTYYTDNVPKCGFRHPEHKLWVFAIDRDWRKRRIRFQKRFIEPLRQNGILASVEKGGGQNCSVEEEDLEEALRVCTVAFTRPGND